jgi:alpha-D-ribose 1-methylphosphonate 5-triphosphate synthase subunit PhnH
MSAADSLPPMPSTPLMRAPLLPADAADILPAFNEPVADAQAVRACLQDALHDPGRLLPLPAGVLASLLPPGRLSPGAAALALSLLHAGQSFWVGDAPMQRRLEGWLAWHTGARPARQIGQAQLLLARACDAQADLFDPLCGQDLLPDALSADRPWCGDHPWGGDRTTLVVDVPELRADPATPRREPGDAELTPRLRLQGIGPEPGRTLAVGGLSRHFWRVRAQRQAQRLPGVDILLLRDQLLCALPADLPLSLLA